MPIGLEELVVEFMRVMAQENERFCAFLREAEGRYLYEYPDDDLPSWEGEWISARAFALSAFRTLHRYTAHAYDEPWIEELRHVQTVIEYMIACRDPEDFWYPDKSVAYLDRDNVKVRMCRNPLDFGWDLLRYLTQNALNKKGVQNREPSRELRDLVSAVGLRVLDRA